MPKVHKEIAQADFSTLLERLTGKKRWLEIRRPDSRTGFDYWYARGKSEANINLDLKWLTISVDGGTIFQGTVEEAANI